jgi:hypothetical protein
MDLLAPSPGTTPLAHILAVSRAFTASKALNLSAKLGVFTLLSQAPQGLNWQAVARALDLKAEEGFRGVADLLDLLVSLGMLQRDGERVSSLHMHAFRMPCAPTAAPCSRRRMRACMRAGDGPGARYSNHPAYAPFLVKGSPDFCGGLLQLNNDRSYLSFEHLEEALRTGRAPPDPKIPDIHQVILLGGKERICTCALCVSCVRVL